jgi:hypothetical protein
MHEQLDVRTTGLGPTESPQPLRAPRVEARDGDPPSYYSQPDEPGNYIGRPVRIGAILALAVAAGFVAWIFIGRSSDNSSTGSQAQPQQAQPQQTQPQQTQPVATKTGPIGLTAEGLRSMSESLKQPIYWVGDKTGYTYEFTRTTNGNLYVRYLPPGVSVGDNRADFLIVVTYPLRDAYAALKRAMKGEPGKTYKTPEGGLAWVPNSYQKSVHVAYQGVSYQVELFDPSPQIALSEVRSGNVRPVS